MDASAKDDCEEILGLLQDAGIEAELWDDADPGVPEGVYEVRVPPASAAEAEKLIDENPLPDEVQEVDDSSDLDLETIYHADSSATGEIEAMGIKNLLESNDIAAVIVGGSVLPNLAFEVRVAKDQVERARELIKDAESHGPDDAQQAEMESES